jgi:aminomethyltransferase
MVEFGGWLMPVQYLGIVAEHRKVREVVGVFDLSHMGRVYVDGPDAERFLQMLATNDVSRLAVGQAQYSLICNREGGVRDDVLVYRLGDGEYLLVVNASNRGKILGWMHEILLELRDREGGAQVSITDRTVETVMVGIQGPSSTALLQPLTDLPLESLGYYRSTTADVMGSESFVSRTGYTGEDGFEVIVPVDAGRRLWKRLERDAPVLGGGLCGLGARDTLRLEAGMPLYGHELGEDVNPFEAGLGRYVHLEKAELVGRDALLRVAAVGPTRRLVGLEVTDRAIARQGTPVVSEGREVGAVTSGSFSPTMDRSIAMALVSAEVASRRPSLEVTVRGVAHPAKVVDLPFYRRKGKSQGG